MTKYYLPFLLMLTLTTLHAEKISYKEMKAKIRQSLTEYEQKLEERHLNAFNDYLTNYQLKGLFKNSRVSRMKHDYYQLRDSYDRYLTIKQNKVSRTSRLNTDSVVIEIRKVMEEVDLQLKKLDTIQMGLSGIISPTVGDIITCDDGGNIVWGVGKGLKVAEINDWMRNMSSQFYIVRTDINTKLNTFLRSADLLKDLNEKMEAEEQQEAERREMELQMKQATRKTLKNYIN